MAYHRLRGKGWGGIERKQVKLREREWERERESGREIERDGVYASLATHTHSHAAIVAICCCVWPRLWSAPPGTHRAQHPPTLSQINSPLRHTLKHGRKHTTLDLSQGYPHIPDFTLPEYTAYTNTQAVCHTHTQVCCCVLTLTLVSPGCSGDSWGGLRDAELLHHEAYCDSESAPSNCRRLIWQLMLKQHSSSPWGNSAAAWEKHNDTSDYYTHIPLLTTHFCSCKGTCCTWRKMA